MKKFYARSGLAAIGLLAGTLAVQGQTAAGSGAVAGGTASEAAAGRAATAPTGSRVGTINTVGGGNIINPGTRSAGAASTIVNPRTTVGGTLNNGGIAASATATPSLTTLPVTVQSVLQPFTASGALGSISQQTTANGVVYNATVTQNGVPMQLQIASNGRVISRTPVTTPTVAGVAGTTTGVGNITTAQAGLPLSTLPADVQQSILSQVGNVGQIQSISQDTLPNGNVFRVTAMQNGVPTEFRFAGNGTLLSAAPLGGTATSAFVPGVAVPASGLLLDSLPTALQNAIRGQVGSGRITGITQQQTPNGMSYMVAYDQNGQPMRLLIGPDGRVISNQPLNAIGNAASTVTGRAASTNSVSTNRPVSLNLEELPGPVKDTLKSTAPDADIRFINREKRTTGDVYVIGARSNDRFTQLEIDPNGKLLRDSRNTPMVAVGRAKTKDEGQSSIPFSTLPVAVQNAVKAYATASNVRSVTLGTDRNSKTVYDVVYYRDGERDRMIVAKDGNLVRVEQNVSPATEAAAPDHTTMIAVGDLPAEVQDTIRRQTDNALIKEINTRQIGDQTVYAINYEKDGSKELLVSTDGVMLMPEGTARTENASTSPSPIESSKSVPLRTIDVTAENSDANTQGTGASAPAERGTRASEISPAATASAPATSSASENRPPSQSVPLNEVPVPVQNTAKKLAGTAAIESINPKLQDSAMVYEITFTQDGAKKTVLVNKDGVQM